jgi:deoxycytidine triphosphate deaminase
MLLSGHAIKDRGLIRNGIDVGYRGASYDVRIGTIIAPDGSEQTCYTLPPQGIVNVVARETVNMPPNVLGFGMVKTNLCNQGVLAINIGIVDPLYQSAVSSFLINFGKTEYALREGDVFLRLTFFEYNQPLDLPTPQNDAMESYVAKKKLAMLQNFSPHFLDLRSTTKSAADEAFSGYKKGLFVWVPIFAFLLALFTLFLNFGNLLLVQRWLQPSDITKAELLRERLDGQERPRRREPKIAGEIEGHGR